MMEASLTRFPLRTRGPSAHLAETSENSPLVKGERRRSDSGRRGCFEMRENQESIAILSAAVSPTDSDVRTTPASFGAASFSRGEFAALKERPCSIHAWF